MSMQQDEAGSAGSSSRTPPYVAYKTFLTLIEDLKAVGVPPRFDRSVLKRFSGGVGAQLLMALRSLGLMDEQNKPTALLQRLVQDHGKPEFKGHMYDALNNAYPFLTKLDLATATPSMYADAFKGVGAKDDVLKKCRRFYLQAASAIGMSIGPRLSSVDGRGTSPRSNGGAATATVRRRRSVGRSGIKPPRLDTPVPPPPAAQSIQQQLVGKYPDFDPNWPEPIQKAWFEGFQKLMSATGTKENGDQS